MNIIGMDVGSSLIKIVETDENKNIKQTAIIKKMSIEQAVKKFITEKNIKKEDIKKIVLTGVGTDEIKKNIYEIETVKINEFQAIAKGGLYLANKTEALVVSIGTGTAFVRAKGEEYEHIGGTGVGGGTLIGLIKQIKDIGSFDDIEKFIENGNLQNIDLTIQDVTSHEIKNLPKDITSSNFGKANKKEKDEDVFLGIINMIYETIGMMAVFATKDKENRDIILVGNLTVIPFISIPLKKIERMHNVNFIIPKNSEFANAIGAIELAQ